MTKALLDDFRMHPGPEKFGSVGVAEVVERQEWLALLVTEARSPEQWVQRTLQDVLSPERLAGLIRKDQVARLGVWLAVTLERID